MRRWNPWRALRSTPTELWFAPLDGERGRWTRTSAGDEILLEQSLDRRTRQEVLAHELVHVERGIGWPQATRATMELEEERVWRIALDRLAPPSEIAAFLRRRGTVGAVTIDDLAEEFDLSPEAADRVARLWAASGGERSLVEPEAVEAERDADGEAHLGHGAGPEVLGVEDRQR